MDRALLLEAIELTERDRSIPRTGVQEDVLLDAYVAEMVAESESLEGHVTVAAEVLNASRDLVLA